MLRRLLRLALPACVLAVLAPSDLGAQQAHAPLPAGAARTSATVMATATVLPACALPKLRVTQLQAANDGSMHVTALIVSPASDAGEKKELTWSAPSPALPASGEGHPTITLPMTLEREFSECAAPGSRTVLGSVTSL